MAGEHEPGSVQPVRRFQFSNGPAGHFMPVLIAAILALGAIAWPAADAIRFFCVLGVIGLTVYAIRHVAHHAKENPIKAALYGAEVTDYQQCLGTKSDPRMLPSEVAAEVIRPANEWPGTPPPSTAAPEQKPLPEGTA